MSPRLLPAANATTLVLSVGVTGSAARRELAAMTIAAAVIQGLIMFPLFRCRTRVMGCDATGEGNVSIVYSCVVQRQDVSEGLFHDGSRKTPGLPGTSGGPQTSRATAIAHFVTSFPYRAPYCFA